MTKCQPSFIATLFDLYQNKLIKIFLQLFRALEKVLSILLLHFFMLPTSQSPTSEYTIRKKNNLTLNLAKKTLGLGKD